MIPSLQQICTNKSKLKDSGVGSGGEEAGLPTIEPGSHTDSTELQNSTRASPKGKTALVVQQGECEASEKGAHVVSEV